MNHHIYLIAAADQNFGIGKNGDLPWRLKEDLQYFQETTTITKDPTKKNLVIMGRKTWESLPEKHRPLPNRQNVVLTTQTDYQAPGATTATSLDKALQLADKKIETIFIIGGGKIYHDTINNPKITGVYLTQLAASFDCDTFFPPIPERFDKKVTLGEFEEQGINGEYLLYVNSSQ